MERPKYPIESVDNALLLLLQLKEQESIGVSDAGDFLDVAPSTAHRLLAMLQYRGFVVQDEQTRLYRAGPSLVEIGLKAVRDIDLRQQARPVLEEIASQLDETVHLLMREGSDVRFIDGRESSRALRVTTRIGLLLPAHCTAGGKALLAELTPDELRELYPEPRLRGVTANSMTRRSQLEKELAKVRERGYAVNRGESEEDVSAVGAVIHDRRGRARGAVAVAIPSARTTDERIEEIAAHLTAAVRELGETID